jgi:plasmid stabilization system protein ParE
MATSYSFHPEARDEYREATRYYLREASQRVADRFVSTIEAALASLVAAPTRWPVVESPEIRRCLVSRFPYVIYFRWQAQNERIAIYAIAHSRREPGYWHHRIEESGA